MSVTLTIQGEPQGTFGFHEPDPIEAMLGTECEYDEGTPPTESIKMLAKTTRTILFT